MKVSDVITSKGSTEVFTIAPDAPISDLLDELAEHNIGALVVCEDERRLVGIVSERDVVRKLRGISDPTSQPVSSIMTTDVHTCAPEDSITAMLETMTNLRIRHVPVISEDGDLVALLSIGDAVKYRMQQLKFERDQLNQYVASAR
ncbi:CBS domain-containing protein [Mumia sp. zg.B53]|uniref:CBS domain-containing protein n=1 Tax=unclassified Mumia TaxID=2621872 RepID=UPI001C6F2E88|nr:MULTISPECIES: CBS domain-containing protein [unclassified Mumia]MBW9206639.1 CBS domain-containing protein [Mumia sp. zg.B17]MBW9211071.1 CBS domain-containing protein [Mumia sp. zg.B21]MBW9215639.1 CBS domain-containing protein [Mumia sp. zg.B53]MDD9347873.1 CBS domain-containing protein [Mumia sp.]